MCGQPSPYVGTVSLLSDDPTIFLPAPYTFTAAESVPVILLSGSVWDATYRFAHIVDLHSPGIRTFRIQRSDAPGGFQLFSAEVVEIAQLPSLDSTTLVLLVRVLWVLGYASLKKRAA